MSFNTMFKTIKESIKPDNATDIFSVGTALFFLIAAAVAPLPILDLFSRVLGFSFHGLTKVIIDTYRQVREYVLASIIDAITFSLSLPFFADLIIIYLFFTFCIMRGSWISRNIDRARYAQDPEAFKEQLRQAAREHNQDPEALVARVESGMKDSWKGYLYYHYRTFRSGLRWPVVLNRNFKQLIKQNSGREHAVALLIVWFLSFIAALAGAIFYIVLSHVSANETAFLRVSTVFV